MTVVTLSPGGVLSNWQYTCVHSVIRIVEERRKLRTNQVRFGWVCSASPRSGDGLPPKVVRTLKRGPSEQDATSRIEVCLGGLPLLLRTVRARLKGYASALHVDSTGGDDLEHGEVIGAGGDVENRELVDGLAAIVVTNVPDVAMVLRIERRPLWFGVAAAIFDWFY